MALNDKKLPNDLKADRVLAEEIHRRLNPDRTLSCASAMAAAAAKEAEPLTVGLTADALRIHLSQCQLGLFGFPGQAKGWEAAAWKERPIPEGFEEALRARLDDAGSLSCLSIWEAADALGMPRMQAGYWADRLGIRVVACQLGAF